ncbi:hypothetical protein SASPL_149499 [Salvia splendens]|uniref:Uncharacterized protein n=1 Tax=Salvia splendens TaxID=180675 RepID=A0A8X8WAX9_SALSN|nr:hypothetical protein SASPL_149499 [Salvia splendens]
MRKQCIYCTKDLFESDHNLFIPYVLVHGKQNFYCTNFARLLDHFGMEEEFGNLAVVLFFELFVLGRLCSSIIRTSSFDNIS